VGALRARFREWCAPAYDLVVFSDPVCYGYLDGVVDGRVIVDLDDVPSRAMARELALQLREAGWSGLGPGHVYRTLLRLEQLRRYRALERHLLRTRTWRLTCSEEDRERLGREHVLVVPNGYERSGPPLGRHLPSTPPRMLYLGSLLYPPNLDAVDYFMSSVLPTLRRQHADATLIVVGSFDDRAAPIARREGVELRGFVDQLDGVLADADVMVVPLRLGGGTRIKILEAFAHEIPVVSTTIGEEGLAVRDGQELLIADHPEALAGACARLFTDASLRDALGRRARALVERDYSWPTIRARFVDTLTPEVLGANGDAVRMGGS
jgi:glycosyltransferase involved in cell wall biosynthesis